MKIVQRTRLIIPLILLYFMTSCSNLSKNTIKEGSFYLRNGVVADKKWIEELKLARLSWYHEMTLQFDLMMGNILPQSGFNFWFSKSELDQMSKCIDFRIVVSYTQDPAIIPNSHFLEQLKQSGFQKIELTDFKNHFLQHPDSELNSFKLYQVFGACRLEKSDKALILNFPGYPEVSLN